MNHTLYKNIVLSLVVAFLTVHSSLAQAGKAVWPSSVQFDLDTIVLPALPQKVAQQNAGDYARLKSLIFAHPFLVGYTPSNSGKWVPLKSDKKIWRLAVRSKNAHTLNLVFDRFLLPTSAQLFIYSPDQNEIIGLNSTDSRSGQLATKPITGDELIVEISCDNSEINKIDVEIGTINHDYVGIKGIAERLLKSSQSCEVDVVCEPIVKDEVRRSVCLFIVDGYSVCTGTLINNTAKDGKPYVYSAAHCFPQMDKTDQAVFFTFEYEALECGIVTGTENDSKIISDGAMVKAISKSLDFALVEMNTSPPANYSPYWCGWNRTTSVTGPVYTVHHPQGDVKKVSVEDDNPIAESFSDISYFESDAHWLINRWEEGATEEGSSGAGLFTQDGYIIGALSGGSATCTTPVRDFFSRFNKAWDYFSEENKQLKCWLDPIGSDAMSLEGRDYYDMPVSVPDTRTIKVKTNPVKNGYLIIDLGDEKADLLEVYNLQGVKVQTHKLNSQINRMRLYPLSSSAYIIVIKHGYDVILKKMIMVK